MAERENILVRLGKLFQNQLVIRKTPTGQLKVKDVNFMQSGLTSNFVDRYQKVMGSYNTSMGRYAAKQNAKNAFDVQRKELFRDYELMDEDPIISSALDIYSDESTVDNVEREILTIKTENNKIYEILHNLYYKFCSIASIAKKLEDAQGKKFRILKISDFTKGFGCTAIQVVVQRSSESFSSQRSPVYRSAQEYNTNNTKDGTLHGGHDPTVSIIRLPECY